MAATVIISAILAAITAVIVIRMIKNARSNRPACGYNCASCPLSGKCRERK